MNAYQYYRDIFSDVSKPLAFLDFDVLERNRVALVERAGGKKIRVASKSVRCISVLKYLMKDKQHFQGIMSYHGEETLHLLDHGFEDILLGYPITDRKHIEALCHAAGGGKEVCFMVDLAEHVRLIQDAAAKTGVIAKVCIDIDMSSRFPLLYFGVYRSAVKNTESLKLLVSYIQSCPNVRLTGLMGYESQIAGLPDNVAGEGLKNRVVRFLKERSVRELRKRRKACYEYLKDMGIEPELVNGGGTGSLESTGEEPYITEVTVGSGFFSSHLFDGYLSFRHEPAVAFMTEITRHPETHIFTCSGGGYTASGAVGANKLPRPYLPEGVSLIANEGAGEVQTPFVYQGKEHLKVGDPVIFRHSKAGEVCERFNELYVVSEGKISDVFLTYRGEGKCFM